MFPSHFFNFPVFARENFGDDFFREAIDVLEQAPEPQFHTTQKEWDRYYNVAIGMRVIFATTVDAIQSADNTPPSDILEQPLFTEHHYGNAFGSGYYSFDHPIAGIVPALLSRKFSKRSASINQLGNDLRTSRLKTNTYADREDEVMKQLRRFFEANIDYFMSPTKLTTLLAGFRFE